MINYDLSSIYPSHDAMRWNRKILVNKPTTLLYFYFEGYPSNFVVNFASKLSGIKLLSSKNRISRFVAIHYRKLRQRTLLLYNRWYTNYNEFIGALAIFLTAAAAVVMEQGDTDKLGPGRIGLALFSVFQVHAPKIPCCCFDLTNMFRIFLMWTNFCFGNADTITAFQAQLRHHTHWAICTPPSSIRKSVWRLLS